MYGVHRPWRGWDLRLNGVAFVQALYEPGDRHRTGGASTRQAGSVNWGMVMARRNVAGGRFGVRTMFSAEPWTVPGCGSLNFLATGEVCEGDTIHDRQQQHDLFMELAVDYDRPLRGAWRWQVYAGLAGEPALGPPGYPHRASAIANPIGPMTHHWLDSTHVTFGVVTVGVHNQRWKAETSIFNGREPDESRVDLDLGAFDSVAARLSFLPTERLALQLSAARLREARTDFPFPLRIPPPESRRLRCITCRLGRTESGQRPWLSERITRARLCPAASWMPRPCAALLESSITFSDRHTVFGRVEVGGMPAHHLHAHEISMSVVRDRQSAARIRATPEHDQGRAAGNRRTVAVSFLPRRWRRATRAAPHRASAFSSAFRLRGIKCRRYLNEGPEQWRKCRSRLRSDT